MFAKNIYYRVRLKIHCITWTIDKSNYSRLMTKISEDGQCKRIVYRGKFRVHKRSSLLNRCIQVDYEVVDTFTKIVKIDILSNKYKVCNLVTFFRSETIEKCPWRHHHDNISTIRCVVRCTVIQHCIETFKHAPNIV